MPFPRTGLACFPTGRDGGASNVTTLPLDLGWLTLGELRINLVRAIETTKKSKLPAQIWKLIM